MHSMTSFIDFQILKLIHFQKNFQGGARQSLGGECSPPAPPERNPGNAYTVFICLDKKARSYVPLRTYVILSVNKIL